MRQKQLSPKSVTPYDRNPRDNSKAIEAVMQSIDEFGFNQPIVVDKDNVIIVGHTRREAAIRLGLKKVPVLVADHLTKAQVKAYRIADNRTNENSFWLEEALAEELLELSPEQRKSTAFTDDELDDMLGAVEAAVPVKAAVEFSEELLESRNYVVLYFDNDIDWLNAKTHFNLPSVHSKRANGKPWSKGIGRVVDGAKYLAGLGEVEERDESISIGDCEFYCRPETYDKHIVEEVAKPGTYFKWLRINPGDRVLDIGANIGAFSCMAAKLGAEVIALEPVPDNVERIDMHIEANGLTDDVERIDAAVVGDRRRKVSIYLNPGANTGNHSVLPKKGREEIHSRAMNINTLINRYKPNKLKIDCEGAEVEIVPAITDANWKGIESVALEVSINMLKDGPKIYKGMVELLQKQFPHVKHANLDKLDKAWHRNIYARR